MKILLAFQAIFVVVYCGDFYKVAVMEYHPIRDHKFDTNIKLNLKNYLNIINDVSTKHERMDLIVFPEATLVTQSNTNYSKNELLQSASLIPEVSSNTIPCLQDVGATSSYVKELSCASSNHKVYVSVDIVERTQTEELYNTNIVFDRQGQIVSRYRKMHTYGEPYINSSSRIVETFTTDFGVTFGVFICFDIIFKESYDQTIQHFIYPTYWFSELPYLSALQAQYMWAYNNNKVLLASNSNNAKTGTGGSGIYLGRGGSLTSYFSARSTGIVIIASIPKNPTEALNATNLFQIRQDLDNKIEVEDKSTQSVHIREDLRKIVFKENKVLMNNYPLENYTPNMEINEVFCYDRFCCSLKVNVNDTKGLTFSIYAGIQDFGGFGMLGVEICGLVQCYRDDAGNNCTSLPPDHYFNKKFKTLEVQVLNRTLDADYFPDIALQDLYFIHSDNFTYVDSDLSLKLTKETVGVYTFGFFGRNYQVDNQ